MPGQNLEEGRFQGLISDSAGDVRDYQNIIALHEMILGGSYSGEVGILETCKCVSAPSPSEDAASR